MNILSNIPPLDLPWQSSLGNLTCLFFKIFFILCLGWAEQRIASQFFLGKKSPIYFSGLWAKFTFPPGLEN